MAWKRGACVVEYLMVEFCAVEKGLKSLEETSRGWVMCKRIEATKAEPRSDNCEQGGTGTD